MPTTLKVSKRDLHPASYRHLSSGHPWVIKDRFTDTFTAKDRLLHAHCKKSGSNFLLIADTAHPKIKARLWSAQEGTETINSESFFHDLKLRLREAFSDRHDIIQENDREDMFLAFGEADFLPGLFLMRLGAGIVIQSYCGFWKKIQKELIVAIREELKECNLEEMIKWISWQDRNDQKDAPLKPIWGKMPTSDIVKEFGCSYSVKFQSGYDLGLYPDMAAIRKRFKKSFKKKNVLNLFAYTGAWSIFGLSAGATSVTSIDLSEKYISWLEENLAMNDEKFTSNHRSITSDVSSALKKLSKNESETFDFIICDPPSFSSDGKKTANALKSNENNLPLMSQLLKKDGELLLFTNTHGLSWKKVKETILKSAKKNGLRLTKTYSLSSDCPTLSGFPEGEYLKGIHLRKV